MSEAIKSGQTKLETRAYVNSKEKQTVNSSEKRCPDTANSNKSYIHTKDVIQKHTVNLKKNSVMLMIPQQVQASISKQ